MGPALPSTSPPSFRFFWSRRWVALGFVHKCSTIPTPGGGPLHHKNPATFATTAWWNFYELKPYGTTRIPYPPGGRQHDDGQQGATRSDGDKQRGDNEKRAHAVGGRGERRKAERTRLLPVTAIATPTMSLRAIRAAPVTPTLLPGRTGSVRRGGGGS